MIAANVRNGSKTNSVVSRRFIVGSGSGHLQSLRPARFILVTLGVASGVFALLRLRSRIMTPFHCFRLVVGCSGTDGQAASLSGSGSSSASTAMAGIAFGTGETQRDKATIAPSPR